MTYLENYVYGGFKTIHMENWLFFYHILVVLLVEEKGEWSSFTGDYGRVRIYSLFSCHSGVVMGFAHYGSIWDIDQVRVDVLYLINSRSSQLYIILF